MAAVEPVPCTVRGVDHVGIALSGLEPGIRLYAGLFGLRPGPILSSEEFGVRGCFLDGGNTRLELLEPTSEESPVARFLRNRGEGLHHLCFGVDDIDASLERLREAGVRLVDEAPRPGLPGGRVAFLHPSAGRGVLLELAEPE